MNTHNLISESVLAGQDLFVLLKSTDEDPYIESYELPIIVIHKGALWGKFREVHSSLGHPVVEHCKRLAYSYSDKFPLVCTSSLEGSVERYISDTVYQQKDFVCRGEPALLWQYSDYASQNEELQRETLAKISESITACRRFKMLIQTDDTDYIIPIHTLEVFHSGRISADTEMDAIPQNLLNNEFLSSLSSEFDKVISADSSEIPRTNYSTSSNMHTVSFLFDGEKLVRKIMTPNDIRGEAVEFNDLKIFAL